MKALTQSILFLQKWIPYTMPIAGLVFTVLLGIMGVVDLFFVLFTGTGTSVSSFLVNVGFNDPVVVFVFGFYAGHLFGYMKPVETAKMLIGKLFR